MKIQLPKGFDLIVGPQRPLKPAFIFARQCSAVTAPVTYKNGENVLFRCFIGFSAEQP